MECYNKSLDTKVTEKKKSAIGLLQKILERKLTPLKNIENRVKSINTVSINTVTRNTINREVPYKLLKNNTGYR